MLNPHVRAVHIPAHALGVFGAVGIALYPSWYALVGFLITNLWLSGLGISVGFHRYFTHRAFTASTLWRRVMLIGGTLAGQGSVVFWTALHRAHHPASDEPADIHTPRKGFWHAYMGWIFKLDPDHVRLSRAADLIRDPWCRATHRHYVTIMRAWWTMLALGCAWHVTRPFACGAFVAGMWSIHQEAIINSVCHSTRWGSAPHATDDDSRDVPALRWLTWGQSLHNTHHRFPARADFGGTARDPGHIIVRLIERSS